MPRPLRIPLAGIHNLLCISSSGDGDQKNYKISACGDAAFGLQFRKGNWRFWIVSVFPQGGNVRALSLNNNAIFWLYFRKRNCRFWIVFPQRRNVNFYVHLRLRGPWTEIITESPLAGMQYFDCISASGTVGPSRILFPQGGNVNFYKHLRLRRTCREPKLVQNLPLRNNILIAFRKRKCLFWIVFPRAAL